MGRTIEFRGQSGRYQKILAFEYIADGRRTDTVRRSHFDARKQPDVSADNDRSERIVRSVQSVRIT